MQNPNGQNPSRVDKLSFNTTLTMIIIMNISNEPQLKKKKKVSVDIGKDTLNATARGKY